MDHFIDVFCQSACFPLPYFSLPRSNVAFNVTLEVFAEIQRALHSPRSRWIWLGMKFQFLVGEPLTTFFDILYK